MVITLLLAMVVVIQQLSTWNLGETLQELLLRIQLSITREADTRLHLTTHGSEKNIWKAGTQVFANTKFKEGHDLTLLRQQTSGVMAYKKQMFLFGWC